MWSSQSYNRRGAAPAGSIVGKTNISISQNPIHFNVVNLTPDRSINSVPYYVRRKQQMKRKNQQSNYLVANRALDLQQFKNQLGNSIKSKGPQKYGRNQIKQITVEPVINENQYIGFNEDDYKLEEKDYVRVCQDKYFVVQNYYNYIYQQKLNSQMYRFAEETRKDIKHIIGGQRVDEKSSESSSEKKSIHNSGVKHVRGPYATKFDPRGGYYRIKNAQVSVQQLAPVHRSYKDNTKSILVKEKERQEQLLSNDYAPGLKRGYFQI